MKKALYFALMISMSAAAEIHWEDRPDINFSISDQKITPEVGQRTIVWQDIRKLSKAEDLNRISKIIGLDQNQLVQASIDSVRSSDDRIRVRNILLAKSVIKIAKPLSEIQKKLESGEIISHLRSGLQFEYEPLDQNNFKISRNMKVFAGFRLKVTFELSPRLYNSQTTFPQNIHLLENLEVNAAAAQLQMKTRNWSNVFTQSQTNIFFIENGTDTLVVSYQIFCIKDAAYSPLYELNENVKSILSDESSKWIKYLSAK